MASTNLTDDFDIKPSPHYPPIGNLHLICPYGQGILQNFDPAKGMVTIRLSHGGVITILQSKVRFHRQHQLFANGMGFRQASSATQAANAPVDRNLGEGPLLQQEGTHDQQAQCVHQATPAPQAQLVQQDGSIHFASSSSSSASSTSIVPCYHPSTQCEASTSTSLILMCSSTSSASSSTAAACSTTTSCPSSSSSEESEDHYLGTQIDSSILGPKNNCSAESASSGSCTGGLLGSFSTNNYTMQSCTTSTSTGINNSSSSTNYINSGSSGKNVIINGSSCNNKLTTKRRREEEEIKDESELLRHNRPPPAGGALQQESQMLLLEESQGMRWCPMEM